MIHLQNLRPLLQCWVLLTSLAAVGPARAHPHVWVHVHTTVLYENGAVSGFRHAWTFDEYYSAMAIEGLDTNKDGTYSREELAELAKVNIDGLKEFGYFTVPQLGTEELAVTVPPTYWLEYGPKAKTAEHEPAKPTSPAAQVLPRTSGAARIAADAAQPSQVLTLHFTLPLAKPVLAEAPDFSFQVQDPTFFIAFEPVPGEAVVLGPGAPKDCRVIVPAADAAFENPSKPGDLMATQPSDPTVRIVSARGYQITCAAKR